MKISLKKIIENTNERDPKVMGSEARKVLAFLQDHKGYATNAKAWQHIFSEYNQKVAEDFISELILGGWIKKDYIDRLDQGLNLTEKAIQLLIET